MADPVDLRVETFVQTANVDFTLNPRNTRANVVVTAVLNPTRTAVLSGVKAVAGDVFDIDLVSAGSSPLQVRNRSATGTILKPMPARSFGRFVFDGADWNLKRSGSLAP